MDVWWTDRHEGAPPPDGWICPHHGSEFALPIALDHIKLYHRACWGCRMEAGVVWALMQVGQPPAVR